MRLRKDLTCSAVCLALAWAAPAAAQNQPPAQTPARKIFAGVVQKVKQVDVLRGKDTQHTVVLLDVGAKEPMIVDLGPTANLKSRVTAGERMAVDGRFVRIGKYPQVMLADRVKTESQLEEIDRPERRARTWAGKVEKRLEIPRKGTDLKNTFVWLAGDDGVLYLVDLGPTPALAELKLAEGVAVDVQGHEILVQRRPVVIATDITVGERSHRIQRSAPPQAEGKK